jgi:TPR repeat protein
MSTRKSRAVTRRGTVSVAALAIAVSLLAAAPARAAADAQSEQLWQQADALVKRSQYQQALPILLEAARRGHPRAQTTLGNLYHAGKPGIAQDDTTAMKWYALGAAQGHRFAQYSLANGYMLGIGGLMQDQAKATQLFEASAQQGLTDAQEAIAMSYELGRGTQRNRARAVYWLDQAARQGDVYAQGFAKILRNPNTPQFRSINDVEGFVTGVFQYCWHDQFPRRRPDLDTPGYQVWQHMAPNWRDSYCW